MPLSRQRRSDNPLLDRPLPLPRDKPEPEPDGHGGEDGQPLHEADVGPAPVREGSGPGTGTTW